MNHSPVGKSTISCCEKYSKIEPSYIYLSDQWQELTKKLILIGTSTGGPSALQSVLTKLPMEISVPIVIVQHMPQGFTKSLAGRLNSMSDIMVKEAEDGETLQNGIAYIAPGGYQLKIKALRESLIIQLDEPSATDIYCPSVDVMFQSAASLSEYGKIAVILTGMGTDGVKGLEMLKKNGHIKAIAESQESCIIFGMPKAAIATGLIDEIENIEKIAATILKYI